MSIAAIVSGGLISGRIPSILKRGLSSYADLPEPPAAGLQYTTLSEGAGWDTQSIAYGLTPAAVTGDIGIIDTLTDPGLYPVTLTADGIPAYDSGGDESVQYLDYDLYDVSELALRGAAVYAVNNLAPDPGVTVVLPFPLGVPITPVDLRTYFPDPESHVVTVNAEEALPSGYTVTSSTLEGTPDVQGIETIDFTAEDEFGAVSEILQIVLISGNVAVPDVDNPGTVQGTAESAIEAAYLTPAFTIAPHATIPENEVISQSPAAGTQAVPFSEVQIVVSSGVEVFAPILLGIPNLSAAFDSGLHQFQISDYFTGATSYAIDPAVEAGWDFDEDTGELEIDTNDEDTFGPFTVTATNDEGSTESNEFTVRVSAWDALAWFGGTAYSDLGVMGSTFLDDATPAVGYIRQGFAHDSTGRRYVALWPADNKVTYQAGIARRHDGAMVIATSGTIASRIQGLAMTFRGEVISAVDTPDFVHNGWPVNSTGSLCLSEVA